jgi:hypothetical protein
MKFCSTCGAKIGSEDKFCSGCGKKNENITSNKIDRSVDKVLEGINTVSKEIENSEYVSQSLNATKKTYLFIKELSIKVFAYIGIIILLIQFFNYFITDINVHYISAYQELFETEYSGVNFEKIIIYLAQILISTILPVVFIYLYSKRVDWMNYILGISIILLFITGLNRVPNSESQTGNTLEIQTDSVYNNNSNVEDYEIIENQNERNVESYEMNNSSEKKLIDRKLKMNEEELSNFTIGKDLKVNSINEKTLTTFFNENSGAKLESVRFKLSDINNDNSKDLIVVYTLESYSGEGNLIPESKQYLAVFLNFNNKYRLGAKLLENEYFGEISKGSNYKIYFDIPKISHNNDSAI